MSRDPLLATSSNRYRYASNRPTMLIDPSGMVCTSRTGKGCAQAITSSSTTSGGGSPSGWSSGASRRVSSTTTRTTTPTPPPAGRAVGTPSALQQGGAGSSGHAASIAAATSGSVGRSLSVSAAVRGTVPRVGATAARVSVPRLPAPTQPVTLATQSDVATSDQVKIASLSISDTNGGGGSTLQMASVGGGAYYGGGGGTYYGGGGGGNYYGGEGGGAGDVGRPGWCYWHPPQGGAARGTWTCWCPDKPGRVCVVQAPPSRGAVEHRGINWNIDCGGCLASPATGIQRGVTQSCRVTFHTWNASAGNAAAKKEWDRPGTCGGPGQCGGQGPSGPAGPPPEWPRGMQVECWSNMGTDSGRCDVCCQGVNDVFAAALEASRAFSSVPSAKQTSCIDECEKACNNVGAGCSKGAGRAGVHKYIECLANIEEIKHKGGEEFLKYILEHYAGGE